MDAFHFNTLIFKVASSSYVTMAIPNAKIICQDTVIGGDETEALLVDVLFQSPQWHGSTGIDHERSGDRYLLIRIIARHEPNSCLKG